MMTKRMDRQIGQGRVCAGAAMLLFAGLTGTMRHAQAQSYDPAQDSQLKQPYVDIDEWRDKPVRHRYVHGGFQGTEARFSIYFPPKEQYKGRFFQHITPTPINEKEGTTGSGTGDQVGFAIASGAYFLVTNEGGMASLMKDPTLGAYRVNAVAAQYSRVLAAQMYGPHRPYGYAYGGSGGAFRTIGGFENTAGVWDGVVPYVVGSPQAIPNVFTARLLALRVLKDKFPSIVDALEPGGGGDPYASLNPEQRQVLAEVTRLGFPVQSWFDYQTIGMGAFPILFGMVVQKDPTYFAEDFWKVPGYAGANPSESLLHARVQHGTTIQRVISTEEVNQGAHQGPMQGPGGVDNAWQQLRAAPAAFQVDSVPTGDLALANVLVKTGAAAGTSFPLGKVEGNNILIGVDMAARMAGGASNAESLQRIQPGDEVQIDNSNVLAAQYYHRYQVPTPDFSVWDQFRGPDGKPIYPQRPKLIGPEFAASAGGTTQSGRFQGKMILLESLWDQDAFPWQADWYASKVKTALGSRFDDHFRVWFTDHALHGDVERQSDPTHTVSYVGVLQQALRDLSAWVEKDIAPPASTIYQVVDGQVQVPAIAAERKGIQPVVTVKANNGSRAGVAIGQPVTLWATIEVPPQTGHVMAAEWSFEGTDVYSNATLNASDSGSEQVTLHATHTFAKPGTYFPVLRVTSERQGDNNTPYTRIQNLGRVRVVVQ
jgi:hypothetical protein